MHLIDINKNPSPRQLRQFAIALAAILLLLAWFSGASITSIAVTASISVAIVLSALWTPAIFRIPFIALTVLLAPVGIVLGELTMMILFVAIFVPIAIALRILGHDPLRLKLDRTTTTYWQRKSDARDPKSYFRRH